MARRLYTRDHMEAACCLWEAILELHEKIPDLHAAFLRHGTAEMRMVAIDLAVEADEIWQDIPEDNRPDTFDWDFCHDFIKSLDWTQWPPTSTLPSHHQLGDSK